MPSVATELLFVYGSLKRGLSNHGMLRGAVYVGEAVTAAGYRLVRIDAYPALTRPGSRAIRGELYRVTPELLDALDAFEGDEYVRERVTLEDGRSAQAYFLAEVATPSAEELDADAWPP